MKKIALITLIQMFILGAVVAEHKELKAFPQAEEGMERLVIELPHKERGEEDSFKVELIPGKEVMTDGVNNVRMGLSSTFSVFAFIPRLKSSSNKNNNFIFYP